MAELEQELERLDLLVGDLEGSIGSAEAMTTAFRSEMEAVTTSMRSASRDAGSLSRSLSGGLRQAFDRLIYDGAKVSEVLSDLGSRLVGNLVDQALKPVHEGLGNALGGAISGLFSGAFANGASFSQGRVRAFADGGIVSGPTAFPMRGGIGLMGEAGPEAILPLSRGSDGALGVKAEGGAGRTVHVVMNISTPDAQSFERSRGQVAARLSRALGRGGRYL